MKPSKLLIALLCLLLALLSSRERAAAQRVSVSTNCVEWLNLGTLNLEAGVAVEQHFSIHAGFRFNNWTFRKGSPEDRFTDPIGDSEKQFENRKQAYAAGVRYWPWYVYSGWWFYFHGQWMEYNRGGLFQHSAEEGTAVGGGLGIGYTYMLNKHWNIEFGASVWGGKKDYTKYRCTNCGAITDKGKKAFVALDDVYVSFSFVF